MSTITVLDNNNNNSNAPPQNMDTYIENQLESIDDAELRLLNVVCATLLYEPRYYSTADENRIKIVAAVQEVAKLDPEAKKKAEEEQQQQQAPDAATATATTASTSVAIKKSAKKLAKMSISNNNNNNNNIEQDKEKPRMPSLKKIVSSLHISQPAEIVMAILGKKYPKDEEEFKKSGLKGNFEPERAGTRMKLPLPETWETQISEHGNNAEVWQQLIDNKKMPFMAMLRNIRNMLVSGLDAKYHDWVINERLTNEYAVVNSRQFPFRFFSAYEVIKQLEKGQLTTTRKPGAKPVSVMSRNKKPLTPEQEERIAKREQRLKEAEEKRKAKEAKLVQPAPELLERYKDALDTAVKIAVNKNVPHLRGYTLAMCDVSGSMACSVSSAKSATGSVVRAHDISLLLGLMLKYVSEQCDMYVFGSKGPCGKCYYKLIPPSLDTSSLLGAMEYCNRTAAAQVSAGTEFFYELFEELLEQKTKVDRMVIFSDVMIDGLQNQIAMKHGGIRGIIKTYREQVNPDFWFIMVDLYGSGKSLVKVGEDQHPRDVLITGFSDQIFRFLSAKENANAQLNFVRNIITI